MELFILQHLYQLQHVEFKLFVAPCYAQHTCVGGAPDGYSGWLCTEFLWDVLASGKR